VKATYGSEAALCELAGQKAPITMNVCTYTLTGKTSKEESLSCTLTIGAQNDLSHIKYVNISGNKMAVTAKRSE
jgi:hypothetical protein